MSYHTKKINKGTIGQFSKVFEEWEELMDARAQVSPVLEICELCDLIGAIGAYTQNKYNLDLEDLLKMTYATELAFETGERK